MCVGDRTGYTDSAGTMLLLKKMDLPTTVGHYHLLQAPTARITHGVDHGAYCSQLARDMGSAPDLWELYRVHGLRILLIYWCVRVARAS